MQECSRGIHYQDLVCVTLPTIPNDRATYGQDLGEGSTPVAGTEEATRL